MIPYYDLLRREWDAVGRCLGVVIEAYSRAGVTLPDGALPTDDVMAEEHWRFWQFLGPRAEYATRELDVIYSDPNHVSVIVKGDRPRVALSAAMDRGVYAIVPSRIRSVVGAYRLVVP